MARFLPAAAAIAAAAACLTLGLPAPDALAGGQTDPDRKDEQEQELFRGMPQGEGRREVFGLCGSCHSIDLVLQQGLSRTVWAEVLAEMADEQQMAPLPPETRKKVLDYLTAYYGPDRRAAGEDE